MSHYFTLHFASEEDAIQAVAGLNLLPLETDDGTPTELPDSIIISQAGGRLLGAARIISGVAIPGEYDPETQEEIKPPIPILGTFVDIVLNRNILPSQLKPYRVPYGSAGHVWANSTMEEGAWPPSCLG